MIFDARIPAYCIAAILIGVMLITKDDLVRLSINLWKWIKALAMVLITPKMLLTFGIAWMITNGWSYLFVGFGIKYGITWMLSIGTAYQAFLWFPFTAEKVVTVAIALWLGKLLFPKDLSLQAKLQALNPANIVK